MTTAVKILGWYGYQDDAQYYHEKSLPTVSYERVGGQNGFLNIRKVLTRTLYCAKANTPTVLQSLGNENTDILSLGVIDKDGNVGEISYGSGWEMRSVNTSSLDIAFDLISISYQKEVTSAFEFGLPIGVTITCSAGVASLKYNGHTLETWTSGTGRCGKGLVAVDDSQNVGFAYLPEGYTQFYYYSCTLYLDDIPMEKFTLNIDDYITGYSEGEQILPPKKTETWNAIYRYSNVSLDFDYPYDIWPCEGWYNYDDPNSFYWRNTLNLDETIRGLFEVNKNLIDEQQHAEALKYLGNPSTKFQRYYDYELKSGVVYDSCEVQRQENKIRVVAKFKKRVYTVKGATYRHVNTLKPFGLSWTLSGGKLRLLYYSRVMREWDVTGLT